MKKMNFKKIIKYLGNIVTILAIVFIIKVMLSLEIDFSIVQNKNLLISSLILGTLIMSSAVFIMAYGWKIILTILSNRTVKYKDASAVYAKANIGKYLPGNVMHYVERNLFAESLGLNQKTVLLSTITEIVGQTCVCIIAGIILEGRKIWNVLHEVLQIKYIILFAVILCIFVTGIIIFRKKIKDFFIDLSLSKFLKAFLQAVPIYLGFILLGGLVLVAIFISTMNNEIRYNIVFSIIAAYTAAWVIGFVVPGSPGGIGVREFVLLFLLRDLFPEAVILTCILIHRMISILKVHTTPRYDNRLLATD